VSYTYSDSFESSAWPLKIILVIVLSTLNRWSRHYYEQPCACILVGSSRGTPSITNELSLIILLQVAVERLRRKEQQCQPVDEASQPTFSDDVAGPFTCGGLEEAMACLAGGGRL
jgi:hypothetical protein